MTVLWIILGILLAVILIVVVLLHFSVKIYIEADKSRLSLRVKYLGIKLYSLELPDRSKPAEDKPPDIPAESEPEIELSEIALTDSTDEAEREEIQKKIDEAAEPEDKKEEPEEKEPKKEEKSDENEKNEEKSGRSLLEKWEEYKQYIPAGKKALRKLLKLIRFYDFRLRLTVGNDDPFKAGKNFGNINAAVYSLIGLLCCLFTVKIKSTEIKCDFEHKAFDIDFGTTVYIRPSAVIALAAYLGYYYLKIKSNNKKSENTAKTKEN